VNIYVRTHKIIEGFRKQTEYDLKMRDKISEMIRGKRQGSLPMLLKRKHFNSSTTVPLSTLPSYRRVNLLLPSNPDTRDSALLMA